MDEVKGYVRIGEWWVKDNYLRQYEKAKAQGNEASWLRVHGVHYIRMEELAAPKIKPYKSQVKINIPQTDNPNLNNIIQQIINNAPSQALRNTAPSPPKYDMISELEQPVLPHQYQRIYEKLKVKSPAEAQAFFNKWAYVPKVEVPMTSQAQTKAEQNIRAMKALEFAQLPADHPKKKLKRRI